MKKNLALILLVVVLGGIYVYYFTDFFKKPSIQLYAQLRPMPSAVDSSVCTVSFALNGKQKLSSVKVVAAADLATNKYPHAVWSLISDAKSEPTDLIIYGSKIPGMKPAIPRGKAEKLVPNQPYVLLLEADKVKGEIEFRTKTISPKMAEMRSKLPKEMRQHDGRGR
jgi:hypothetical protein